MKYTYKMKHELRRCSLLLMGICAAWSMQESQAAEADAPGVSAEAGSSVAGVACGKMEGELIKKMMENEQYALTLLKGVVDKQTADAAAPAFVKVSSRRAAFRGAVYSMGYTMQELSSLRNAAALQQVMSVSKQAEAELERIKAADSYGSDAMRDAAGLKTRPEPSVALFTPLLKETRDAMLSITGACALVEGAQKGQVLASYYPQIAELCLNWQLFNCYSQAVPETIIEAYRAEEPSFMAATSEMAKMFIAGDTREYAEVIVHMLPPVSNAVLKHIVGDLSLQNAMLDDIISAYEQINAALSSVKCEATASQSLIQLKPLFDSHRNLFARAQGYMTQADVTKLPKVAELQRASRVFEATVRNLESLEKPYYGNEGLKNTIRTYIGVGN